MNGRQKRQKNLWLIIFLFISIFTFIFAFRASYGLEINRFFDDQRLTLKTRINFSLELALRKYDGQKIWLIYSIDSYFTIKENGISRVTLANENPTLAQVIQKETNEGNKQDILDHSTAVIANNIRHISPNDLLQSQLATTKNNTSYQLAIILDYSLESGRPCLYQIYLQQMNQSFLKEPRAMFWLGEVTSSTSINWLITQFHQTKYEKLKQQIIRAIGVHNCTNKVVEYQKSIIQGAYPLSSKMEAIYWLGKHNSSVSIDLLTHLAINNKDTLIRKKALFALSQIKDKKALTVISALAKKDKNLEVRQEAIFWLSQIGNDEAIYVLNKILNQETNSLIRKYTIFAISQLPEKKAMPLLSYIAQKNPDSRIRKKAIFWLGQTRDQRVMDFLFDLYDERTRQGSN